MTVELQREECERVMRVGRLGAGRDRGLEHLYGVLAPTERDQRLEIEGVRRSEGRRTARP